MLFYKATGIFLITQPFYVTMVGAGAPVCVRTPRQRNNFFFYNVPMMNDLGVHWTFKRAASDVASTSSTRNLPNAGNVTSDPSTYREKGARRIISPRHPKKVGFKSLVHEGLNQLTSLRNNVLAYITYVH